MAATDFTDRRRIKLDKLKIDTTTGAIEAYPAIDGTVPQIVNVLFGTGSPPDPSTVPRGTLFMKYTP